MSVVFLPYEGFIESPPPFAFGEKPLAALFAGSFFGGSAFDFFPAEPPALAGEGGGVQEQCDEPLVVHGGISAGAGLRQ